MEPEVAESPAELNAESTAVPDDSATAQKREKDPQKRLARKQNKRQKYKDRQAQKQNDEKSSSSHPEVSKSKTTNETHVKFDLSNAADEITASAEEEEKLEAPKSMAELLARIQEEEAAKNARARDLFERAELEKMTPEDFERVRDKKRVYAAWIGDYGDQNKRAKVDPVGLQMKLDARSEKDPKQHRGLRCKKCFCLLARDEDFEFRNNLLWLVGNHRGWDGTILRGDDVFCQNNHRVGHRTVRSFASSRTFVPVIKPDKTTWEENFVKNPEFAGSDFIKNKPLQDV